MSITTLSCNIRKSLPEDDEGGNGWEARKDLCFEVIRAQGADVICLQECSNAQLTDVQRRLPEFESFGLANPGELFNPTNLILFSKARFDLISAGGFWLSETPHVAGSRSWDCAHPRFANWVQLRERDSGRELRVWNTHFDHIGQLARERQAQIVVEASTVFPDELPQLLTGDLNADATNAAVKRLTDAGWLDTYAAVHGPQDPGFTFHAFLGPDFPTQTPQHKIKGKIDWILYRGPVWALAAAIIRDGRNGRYPSDHYFVSAEVTLGRAAEQGNVGALDSRS